MELRHLRYFVAVAHEGHVTRAAEKLHIQQPPLSQQIRALEREIDAVLFVRHPRGVSLTDAGRSFLTDAEAILAQAEHAKMRARRTARGEVGRIAVGFTTSAPFHPLVARAIREFRTTRPDVSFVLEESSSGDMVSGLRDERLDAHADDERAVGLFAHEERPEMVQERTGSKQRLEAGRGIGIGHGTNPTGTILHAKNECCELNAMHGDHARRRTRSMKPSVAAERSSARQARLSGTLSAGRPFSVR